MRVFAWLIYMIAAALFTALYFRPEQHPPGATLADLAALRAATPYQYRVLVPILARLVEAIAPLPLPAIYAALTCAFTLGLFLVWRAYLHPFFGEAATVYALAMLYPLIWNYVVVSAYYCVWDVPAIFFFVLGLVLMRRQQWRLYYLVFLLACFNRETSCFLILACALLQWGRQPTRWLAWNLALQGALWLAVKALLTRIFLHNPGEKVGQPHLSGSLELIGNLLRQPLGSLDWVLLTFGWMAILIVVAWRTLPADFKRLLLIVGPFLLGMAFVADLGQLRIYNELVPVLLAPALWSVETWRRRATVARAG
ncbi:MAG: DUF2079 domain-containing protein [Armatimonadota bacterium]|nr:DUF2079 domain-containing protein [Armatimonadota bacterium]